MRMGLVNSLRSVVKRGFHQGLHLGEGQERGVCVSIVEVRVERAEEDQWSNCVGEGLAGGGGHASLQEFSPERASQCLPI